MTEKPLKEILVVGNGSVGWVVSYMLMSMLGKAGVNIKYINIADEKSAVGTINSVSNFSDIFQLLSLLKIDLGEFFKICSATPFVGYSYSDLVRGTNFVHSFSGYDKSYGRRISDDVIPFVNKVIPEMGYEDFSLSAQMAENGKFFSLTDLISNPSLLAGNGISFSENKFVEMLNSVHSKKHFEYIDCQNVEVDFDAEGCVNTLKVDEVSLSADLYVDCTGYDRKIIRNISNLEEFPAIGFSKIVIEDSEALEKPAIDCLMSAGGLLKKEKIKGFSQITEYIVGDIEKQNFTPYITTSPWCNNVVAVGDASGGVCNVVLSELDLAINQIKLLVESFPRSSATGLTKQYFNRIIKDQLFWLYQFNWLVINFHKVSVGDNYGDSSISIELSERLMAFRRTGFVFTDDNEIFSDLFWKSFLLGNKCVYDGGFDCVAGSGEAVLDLLMEKIKIHRQVNGMSEFRSFFSA